MEIRGRPVLLLGRAQVADTRIAKTARTAETVQAAGGGGAEEGEHERTDTDGGAWAARAKEFGDDYLYKIAAVLSQQPDIPLETLSSIVGIIGDAVIGQAKVPGFTKLSELTPELRQLATYWQVPYMCCLFSCAVLFLFTCPNLPSTAPNAP